MGEGRGGEEIVRLKLLAATRFEVAAGEAKTAGGKMKGMEERDHAFGRLFGILAVVRSGVLGLEDFPLKVTEGYTQDLIELYNYKKWLREPAANAIIELMSSLDDRAVASITNGVLFPKFFLAKDKMDASDKVEWLRGLNAEQIAVVLHLQLHKNISDYASPLNKAILSEKTIPLFAQAFTATSTVVYPRCHIVWNAMWMYLTEGFDGGRQLRNEEYSGIIKQLIIIVVINSLLGKGEGGGSPSNERRSLALQIVSSLAGASNLRIVLPSELISAVICPDVVERVFLNVMCASGGIGMKKAKSTDVNDGKAVEHHLKSLTASTLSEMVACCSDEDSLNRRMAFVKSFVSVDPRFDVRTKTQTVNSLLMMENNKKELTAEEDGLRKALWNEYLAFLEEAIISADTLHQATMYVELMFKLAKRDLLSAPANVARRVIRFFMTAAFFDCSGVSSPTKSKKTPSKKKKGKKTSEPIDDVQVPLELASAIRIKELLQAHKLESVPYSSRTIMSARFYSLLSDFISTVNAQSRGGNKSKSFYGNVSKPEAVYRALSEISGTASVFELSGVTHLGDQESDSSSDDESPFVQSRRHVLGVKKMADEALVNECGSSDDEVLRAKSVFATGCASLMLSLHLQLNSCGDAEKITEEEEDAQDDNHEALHEFIADLHDIISDFSCVIEKQTSEEDNDQNENPLAAFAGLLVNVLSSSVGGEESAQANAALASASKLTRETVKLAWSGVLSLISSFNASGSTDSKIFFVDEDVMSTLIESVCGASALKNDEQDGDESIDESDDDESADQVFNKATEMDLDLNDPEAKTTQESENDSDIPSEPDEVELDPSKLENMLLEDSDAEIDVLEHHAGADKALAQLIKMKQDTRKASQSERERIDLCNRLRCAGLLESLFSSSVLKSGWLPLEAVLGSFLPILRSFKALTKSLEKSTSTSQSIKTVNEKKSLLDKLASLIKDRLSKFRCGDVTGDDTQLLRKAILDISEELKHSLSLAHSSCCSISLVTLIRCIPGVEKDSEVASIYSNALKDWSTRKSTKIHTCVFDDLIQRMPSLATVVLTEPLITSAKDAHSGFLKCECIRLISLLYRGEMSSGEEALSEMAQTILSSGCNRTAVVLKESLCDASLHKVKNSDEVLNASKHFLSHVKAHPSTITLASCNDLRMALKTAADLTKSIGTKNTCLKLADEVSEVAKNANNASDPKPPKSASKKKKKSKN